jgi:chloramphenicol 3-O phosphotransferase
MRKPGAIVILNGAPRSGKSSLARALQEQDDGVWMTLGVDAWMAASPPKLHPGLGLRPGGERPDLEWFVEASSLALYGAARAASEQGLSVAMDLGHHDSYTRPLRLAQRGREALQGLPYLVVGVRCSLEEVMRRRVATGWTTSLEPTEPVRRWQEEVHHGMDYDLVIDTQSTPPAAGALKILGLLQGALAQ